MVTEDPRSVPEHPGSDYIQEAGSHRIYSSPLGYMESIIKSLRFSNLWEWTRLNASSSSEPHRFRASARVIRSCAESQGRQIHTEHPIAPEIHHGTTESRQRLAVRLRYYVKLANDSRLRHLRRQILRTSQWLLRMQGENIMTKSMTKL